MKTRPNESAFPWICGDWSGYEAEIREGLTKREYMAAEICAKNAAHSDDPILLRFRAELAVKQADALIAALSQEEGPADA